MINTKSFIDTAGAAGFRLYTGVPCSYLKPFINYVIDSDELTYIGAANEGDAVAIASGAELGGTRSVVMFQNSGFGNTVNPLTSLNAIFKIPVLLIATLRGEPDGPHDEPQHQLMGGITTRLFDLMRIPWEYFPVEESQVAGCLERVLGHMARTRLPYGLVMKKDSVTDHKLRKQPAHRVLGEPLPQPLAPPGLRPSRAEVLTVVQRHARPNDALVATTGYTGRELYACADRPNQFYMVGSMGCASSFGLGLAWARPRHRVIVLDGDGAALMRMGAFATLGYERPPNLLHLLLDNEVHESTGAQATVSHSVDLAQVARGCGYPVVHRIASLAELEKLIAGDTKQLTFALIKTGQGVSPHLPRPSVTPPEVADRFRAWLDDFAQASR